MDKKLIQEMIDIIDKNNISELEVGSDKLKISIKKTLQKIEYAPASQNQIREKEKITDKEEEKDLKNCFTVTSPLAGIFYVASSPGAPVFVEVGDKIEAGQTLCIVEAMKLMNEISSDKAGIIKSIEVKNEEPVEAGKILFYILNEGKD